MLLFFELFLSTVHQTSSDPFLKQPTTPTVTRNRPKCNSIHIFESGYYVRQKTLLQKTPFQHDSKHLFTLWGVFFQSLQNQMHLEIDLYSFLDHLLQHKSFIAEYWNWLVSVTVWDHRQCKALTVVLYMHFFYCIHQYFKRNIG